MSFSKPQQGNERGGLQSSAVSSVLYSRGNTGWHEETRSGAHIYSGEAHSFHEWSFRTRLFVRGKTGDAYTNAAAKVVDGLRGDAFVVAQELGLEELWKEGVDEWNTDEDGEFTDCVHRESGIEKLVNEVRATVFPLNAHEAKELFRQYTKPSGALSRQRGESMAA